MLSHQNRRRTWERVAFVGSIALAMVVLIGSLGASSRVAPARSPDFSGLKHPTPPIAGVGADLNWVVEGVAWQNETVEVEDAGLAPFIDKPLAVQGVSTKAANQWAPLAAMLQRRMAVVHDDEATLVLGEDTEGFRARLTFIKTNDQPLLAGARLARRDRGDAWRVTTSRLIDSQLPPLSAAPLPLAVGDRLTAAGLSADGTVQAALVEPTSKLDRLAASWRSAGWEGSPDDLGSHGDTVVYQRRTECVRVTRINDDQLAFVRLTGPLSR